MLASNTVTAEAAGRHDGTDGSQAREVAGSLASPPGEPLRVRDANGDWQDVRVGQWVVRFMPGDLAVMDDGEYRRWFGKGA